KLGEATIKACQPHDDRVSHSAEEPGVVGAEHERCQGKGRQSEWCWICHCRSRSGSHFLCHRCFTSFSLLINAMRQCLKRVMGHEGGEQRAPAARGSSYLPPSPAGISSQAHPSAAARGRAGGGWRAASMLPLLLHIRSRTIPSHGPNRPPACSRRDAVASHRHGAIIHTWLANG